MAKWIQLRASEHGETIRLRTDRIVGLRDMRQVPTDDGRVLSPDPYQTEVLVDFSAGSFMVQDVIGVVQAMLAAQGEGV